MIGTTELLIIAAIVLVLFGSTAIPKFARSLGRARKEFEAGVKEGMHEGTTPPAEVEGERKDSAKP
jgi:sec-independent protein translocase protein TatA